MASNDEDLCTSHADFAVICSFIEKFGEKLGLTLPNIGELQSSLEDTDNVNPIVSQCVSQLLRRINKSVKLDRWERGLQRFAHSYSHQDGWELERFGFKKAKLEVKIRVIKALLEAQFDLYKSFKDKVNSLGANELRLQPCGRDKKGVSYWCQLDECANLRIYSDDQDEETWTLVASTREELVTLIAELESESPPGASREMSVEGSHSGTATPMGLSEAPTPVDSKAPTPVDSKAPTPVASGRTSPVIDTGQDKDNDKKDKLEEQKPLVKEEILQKMEVKEEVTNMETETSMEHRAEKVKEIPEGAGKMAFEIPQPEVSNHKDETGTIEKVASSIPESSIRPVQNSEEVKEKQIVKDNSDNKDSRLMESSGELQEKQIKKEDEPKASEVRVADEGKSILKMEDRENKEVKQSAEEKTGDKKNVQIPGKGVEDKVVKEEVMKEETTAEKESKDTNKNKEKLESQVSTKLSEKDAAALKTEEMTRIPKDTQEKTSEAKMKLEKVDLEIKDKETLGSQEKVGGAKDGNKPKEKDESKELGYIKSKDKDRDKDTIKSINEGKEKESGSNMWEEHQSKSASGGRVKAEDLPPLKEQQQEQKQSSLTEKTAETTEKKADAITTQKKVDSSTTEKNVGATTTEKRADPLVTEKKVDVPVTEKKAEVMTTEKKAEVMAAAVMSTEKKAEAMATEKKAEAVTTEKKTEAVTMEKKVEVSTTGKKEDASTTEKKPDAITTQKKADLLTTEKKVEALTVEKKAEGMTTEKKVDLSAAEKKGDLSTTEKKGDFLTIEKKGGLSTTEKKGNVSTAEKKEDLSATEKKGDLSATEKKGDLSATEKKGDLSATEKKGDLLTTEKKGDISAAEKKGDLSSTEKKGDLLATEKKGDLSATEKKTDILTTEKKVEIATTEKKVEIATTEKKVEIATTEKKASMTPTEKKAEIPAIEMKAKVMTTDKKIDVATTEKKAEVLTTEKKVDTTSTEKKLDAVATEKKPEVTVAEKKADVTPVKKTDAPTTEKKAEITATEKKVEVTTTEKKADVTPAVKPTMENKEVTPTEKKAEITPTEKKTNATPMDKKADVPTTEKPNVPNTEKKAEVAVAQKKADVASTEKKTEETASSKKDESAPEPMDVDDTTKALCQDIAAKKTMLVRERGSSLEGPESKERPKLGVIERIETKKKESVWDKLNKMKEKGEAKTEDAGEKKTDSSSTLPVSSDKQPKEKQEHITPKVEASSKLPTSVPIFQRAWEDKVTDKPTSSAPLEVSATPRQQQAPKAMSIESLVGPSVKPSGSPSPSVPAIIRSSSGGLPSAGKDDTVEPPQKKFKFSDMSSLESHSESHTSDSKPTQKIPPPDPPPPLSSQTSKEGKSSNTRESEKVDKPENLSCEKVAIPKDGDAKPLPSKGHGQDITLKPGADDSKEATRSNSSVDNTEVNKGNSGDTNTTKEALKVDPSNISSKEAKTTATVTAPTNDAKESEKNPMKTSSEKPSQDPKEDNSNATIEEPVMLIKGDGEGAMCEAGNEGLLTHSTCPSERQPWWEHFSESNGTTKNLVGEAVEEEVMYFWGEGTGAECEAGNNGDETESNTETSKQGEGGGSGGAITNDSQRNTSSADLKPPKEVEGIKSDGEVKGMDGVCEGDEAKVNGLRTVDSVEKTSDKATLQEVRSEVLGDSKHANVNGKKVSEENNVRGEQPDGLPVKSSEGCENKEKKENPEKIPSDKVEQDTERCSSNVGVDSKGEGNKVKSSSEEKESEKTKQKTIKKKESEKAEAVEEEEGDEEEEVDEEEEMEEEEEEGEDEEDEEEEDSGEEMEDKKEKETRSKEKLKGRRRSSHERKLGQRDSAATKKGSKKRGRGRPHKRSKAQQESEDEGDDDDENDLGLDEENDEQLEEGEERMHSGPPAKKRRQRGKGSTARPLPDVPRQKSARIAKIREKEEQERRELEAIRLKQLAEENRLREIKKKAREERRSLREMKKGRREKKEKKDREKKKRKKKKRGKKKKTPSDPWAHSSTSSSSSSEEEEEDLDDEEEEDEKLVFKSDHEFSPESDIEEDAQPIKRARTAKKLTSESEVEEEGAEEEEEDEDETQCTKCGHDDHPETILLCDNCDAGWHLSCLRPPLLSVPEGDWICPTCEHVQLVNKLRALLHEFDECQKRAQNEELRRQRLAYVNVSLSNVINDGKKKKKKHRGEGEEFDDDDDDDDESDSDSDSDGSDSDSDDSSDSSSQSSSDSTAPLYTLRARSSRTLKEQVENFDEMINEAIRDEMEAAAGAGNAGRGKDIENIIQANEEEMAEQNENPFDEEEDPEECNKSKDDITHPATKEECEGKREREGDEDEDEEGVSPKRKKPKPTEEGSGDDDNYKVSEEDHGESDSEEDIKISRRQRQHMLNISVKKRRRLTDLDAEDDDDASDEDFMNSSEDEDDETEESLDSSSSISTDLESDDSDVVDMKRRRSSRYENLPLRRSARNRRGRFGDEDSENEERVYKKLKNKKKKKRRHSSSEEDEELSSDSDGSFPKKKKVRRRKKPTLKQKGKRGIKGRGGKKLSKAKPKPKKHTDGDGEENKKPSKPRIKYAKPPKSKQDDGEEEVAQRRVTRGRQVNYYDALMMSDETEEEEPKKKWRGKVMKGERVPTESSEYEASDDERMKRRGVSGGLGRGKVMKGEEEDEDKHDKGKKKRGRPKKGEELLGKPSIIKVAALETTKAPIINPVQSLPASTTVTLLPAKTNTVAPPVIPTNTQTVVTSAPAVQVTPILSAAISSPVRAVPTPPAPAHIVSADSPSHNTPEPAAGTPPTTPAPAAPSKGLTITPVSNVGNSSPIHQPVGKWSPHLSGVGGTPSTPPRSGGPPGAATPPRPGLPAAPVTASPPPPYRSSPLPMTQGGPGLPPCSSAPSNIPPGGPPPTTSALSQVYAPYRPPPEHFPAHPAFPGYAPPGRHSPSPHTPSRHPAHLPPGHALPRMPPNYGPPPLTSVPGQGPYSSRGIPSHPGVLRGPPHDLYRAAPGSLPGHGSPSHPGHPHLIMKPGYPGLEPLPYAGSPGPSPLSLHQSSQGSPAHHSPSEDSKEETHPSGKGPGEFSSGLMSYFSSQRDDDIE